MHHFLDFPLNIVHCCTISCFLTAAGMYRFSKVLFGRASIVQEDQRYFAYKLIEYGFVLTVLGFAAGGLLGALGALSGVLLVPACVPLTEYRDLSPEGAWSGPVAKPFRR